MDYSFYGGRKGDSFIISGRFRYISSKDMTNDPITDDISQIDNFEKLSAWEKEDIKKQLTEQNISLIQWTKQNCMIDAFKQGGSYNVVRYDEYAIIDSFHKTNSNNGKIYRRGYDFHNDMGGAIYLGQIVGPIGYSPDFKIKDIDEIEKDIQQAKSDNFQVSSGEGDFQPVPGRKIDTEGNVINNKTIKWKYVSIRDKNNESADVHLGFEFPYLVIDYSARRVSPYDNVIMSRIDEQNNPYYEKWDFTVPEGIKGESFNNIRIAYLENGEIKDFNPNYLLDPLAQEKKWIIAVDTYNYDVEENPKPVTVQLGQYNLIKNISLSEDGTLKIDYTYNDSQSFEKRLKWISDIQLSQQGDFIINYNNGDEPLKKVLNWIDNADLAMDGTLSFFFNDHSIEHPHQIDARGKLKWVTECYITEPTFSQEDPTKVETGSFLHIDFNDGTFNDFNLKVLNDIDINTGETEGTGSQKVKISYINGKDFKEEEIGNPLNYIMETRLTADSHLLVLFSDPAKRQAIVEAGKNYIEDGREDWYDLGYLKVPTGITINTGEAEGEGSQKIAINYPDKKDGVIGSYTEEIGNPLNYIMETVLTEDSHLLILFSDPAKRQKIVQAKQNYSYQGRDDWYDLGYLKVPTNISIDTGDVEGEGSQKININYPNGTNELIGNPLNYIMKTEITPDFHLLTLFSDPAKRQEIISQNKNYNYQNRNDWYDLGCIKTENGILIGKNFEKSYFQDPTPHGVITKLNQDYPNGFDKNDKDLYGKIATVGNAIDEKEYYAFDYTFENGAYKGWFYLGTFSDNNSPGAIASRVSDDGKMALANSMPINSLWFVIEDDTVYNIQITAHNGTIESDKTGYKELDIASISFAPKQYHELEWVKVDGVLREDITISPFNIDIWGKNHTVEVSFKPIVYKMTVNNGGNGQVTTDKTEYLGGETAQITCTPDQGYLLDTIQIDSEKAIKRPENPYSLVVEDNHKIGVTFSPSYKVDITVPNGGGEAVADRIEYLGEETAKIKCSPDEGMMADYVILDGGQDHVLVEDNVYNLPMNGKSHTVEVYFKVKPLENGDLVKLGTLSVNGIEQSLPAESNQAIQVDTTNIVFNNTVKGKELQWRYAELDGKKLLVCDRNIIRGISWNTLNNAGFVNGKEITIDGKQYKCRLMTGGTSDSDHTCEWNKFIADNTAKIGVGNDVWHWQNVYSWCSNAYSSDRVVVRGGSSASNWNCGNPSDTYYGFGFRPILEIL